MKSGRDIIKPLQYLKDQHEEQRTELLSIALEGGPRKEVLEKKQKIVSKQGWTFLP